MAGLLSDVLPFIYSRSNALKRNVNSLLDAPFDYFKQGIGQGNDDARVQNGLLAAAVKEKGYGPANQALQNQTSNFVVNSIGPLATVWHGSPHKFDKFDASKIGTGEGAQAYGHGLYLAESPDVAGQYQKTLAADGFLVGDKVFDPSSLQHLNVKSVARKGDVDAAIAKAQEIANSGSPVANMAAQDLAKLQEIKAAGGMKPNTGSLYKVDLPDEHIAKMLDWDKPLSEQHPDVQKALSEYGDMVGGADWKQALQTNDKGSWFYRLLEDVNKNSPRGAATDTANDLRQAGIPGIRYLDGGSRGTGAGTSNFVVFPGNEGLLTILERNGQPVNQLSGLLGY